MSGAVVAVTGANGFVGCATANALERAGVAVRRLVRVAIRPEELGVGDIGAKTDWSDALKGVDCIIHTAARVHVMRESAADPILAYREVNVEGTRQLAEQALILGIRRMVFVSSIKVNGEETTGDHAYSVSDVPSPADPYGQSKWEAEQLLWDIARRTGLRVVVVRPPLVYGAGVKGNFARLMAWVNRGLPIPLGAVKNRRSMIGVGNLADLLVRCSTHDCAPGQTFLASDEEELSTPELIRRLGELMGRPARLWAISPFVLKTIALMSGKTGEIGRLIGSLRVDMRDTMRILEWRPPQSLDEGLRQAISSLSDQS